MRKSFQKRREEQMTGPGAQRGLEDKPIGKCFERKGWGWGGEREARGRGAWPGHSWGDPRSPGWVPGQVSPRAEHSPGRKSLEMVCGSLS